MAIFLGKVRIRTAIVRVVDFAARLTPPLGGPVQRVERMGTRYALDVELPPIPEDAEGRLLTAMLQQAMSEGALMPFPQPGLRLAAAGTPVVDGAITNKGLLPLRGFAQGSVIRKGQYLSVVIGGRRYLHRAKIETLADPAGKMVLPIMPLLRASATDGDLVELKPMIEGWIEAPSWGLMLSPFTDVRFSIEEGA